MVVVHWSRLDILIFLNRADQNFVRHGVKHVQKLLLLNVDDFACNEEFGLRLHLDIENKLHRDHEDENEYLMCSHVLVCPNQANPIDNGLPD